MKRIVFRTHAEDERGNVLTVLYNYRVDYNGKSFIIPRGFESDGASVPRMFWRVVFPSTDSDAVTAGICHDYIYREQPADWTREEADRMFLALLVEFGVGIWSANRAYDALRLFGWSAWDENAAPKATAEAIVELKSEAKKK